MKQVLLLPIFFSLFLIPCFAQDNKESIKTIQVVSDFRPKAILLPKPKLPKGVKSSGQVSVFITTDEQGNAESAEATTGHPLLRKLAEKAALKAKFKPVSLSGKRIKMKFPVVYSFGRKG